MRPIRRSDVITIVVTLCACVDSVFGAAIVNQPITDEKTGNDDVSKPVTRVKRGLLERFETNDSNEELTKQDVDDIIKELLNDYMDDTVDPYPNDRGKFRVGA